MQSDITETLITHFSLAEVLAFAVARAEVRGIEEPAQVSVTSPTMRCQPSAAYIFTRRLAA